MVPDDPPAFFPHSGRQAPVPLAAVGFGSTGGGRLRSLARGLGGLEPSAPCGTEAERAQWAKKRGGASGTARSTACGATMQAPRIDEAKRNVGNGKERLRDYSVSRTEIPQRSPIAKRSKKMQSGSEAIPDGG